MKRWLLILIFSLLAIIGFAVTSDVATNKFLDWYVSYYAKHHFDSTFQYDHLSKENGEWVIDHPRLLHEGTSIFSAEKARLSINLHPLSRTIDLFLKVTSPTVAMGRPFEKTVDITAARSPKHRLIYMNRHVTATNGMITFSTDKQTAPLSFSVDATFGKRTQGILQVASTKDVTATLVATITQQKHGQSHVDVVIDKMEVAPFFELLHICCPKLPQMAVQSGQTSGNLELDFYRDHKPSASGALVVQDLHAAYGDQLYVLTAPEIVLKLASDGDEDAEVFMPTSGQVDLVKGTALTLMKEGVPFWSFDQIGGFFAFNTHQGGHFAFDALCLHHDKNRKLNLEGNLRLSETLPNKLSFKTKIISDDSAVDDVIAHLSMRHLADQWHLGEIEISGITHEEFNFLKYLISPFYPSWNSIEVDDGTFEAGLLVYMRDFQLQEVRLEKLQANRVVFRLPEWNFSGSANNLSGQASIDLSQDDPAASVNAVVDIVGGSVTMSGLAEKEWKFEGIDSIIKVYQGILQESTIRGSVAGMHGEMVLNGANPDQLIQLIVSGATNDLAPYLPKHLKKIIDKQFTDHKVVVEAKGKSISGELEIDGTLKFSSASGEDAPIYFSVLMDRPEKGEGDKKPAHHVISEYLQVAGMDAIAALIPREGMDLAAIAARGDVAIFEPADGPRWNLFGYALSEGKFESNNLPLEKYLSPFIFQRDQMNVGGSGAFFGSFTSHSIKVDYDATDLILKNNDFVIEIKKICHQNELCKPWVATHYFDLDEDRDYGVLPVSGGSYFEKNSGLLFTDIDALIFLQNNKIHVFGLSTYSNGLHFTGKVDIDWSMPGDGVFEVVFAIDEMSGKVSQIQHLFTHFNQPFVFTKIPIEGNIALREKGALLRFHFDPDDYTMDSTIHGVITDGSWKSPGFDMILNDMSMNFFYDHTSSVMDFSDLQATVLVGSANHFEEYVVAGDGIHFSNYAQQEAEFDIWVADKDRDIARIAGKTHTDHDLNDELVISVDLDKARSHFGTVHPKEFELILSDWSDLLIFNLDFEFGVNALFSDLQRFSRTGLLLLSRSVLKELNNIKKADGHLIGSLNYKKSTSTLEYQIHGKKMTIDDYAFDEFQLVGNKRGNLWSIEQLQFDKMSLSLDLHQDPQLWNINFLGARLGSSVLLGMEGVYLPNEDRLRGKINLCEVDIALLKEWPAVASWIEERGLAGTLRTHGTVDIVFDRSLPELAQVDFQATGSLAGASIGTLRLNDIPAMSLAYHSSSGWSIGNVQTSLLAQDNPDPKLGFYLTEAQYDPARHSLKIENLNFSMFASQRNWLVRHLENHWGHVVSTTVVDLIGNLKSKGSIQGNLSFSYSDMDSDRPLSNIRLSLTDDVYRFEDSEFALQNLVLESNEKAIQVSCNTPYQNLLWGVKVTLEAPSYDRGEVVITQMLPQESDTISPLTIRWNSVEPHGFAIEKVKGYLCGVTCDLVPDSEFHQNPHFHYLVGTVDVDFNKAIKLMAPEQAAGVLGAQIGQGYALFGRYGFEKSHAKSFGDRLYFQGELLGSSFDFMGYRLNHLSAHVDYQPLFATVTNLALSDASGQITIPQFTCSTDAYGQWQLFIPSILFKDIRPSALESVIPSINTIKKSMVIRSAEITNISGYLADRNTYQGEGKLHFVNPQKKNFQHTIFAIPAELLTRIGLDLGVLTPVRGNVEFEVREGKVVLKKFKDVYSKGRVSKFSLVSNGYESYVDFDGNVHVQIKMKQYNLIFKLAELFNVTIGGTLSKPTYSLQKQNIGGNRGGAQ